MHFFAVSVACTLHRCFEDQCMGRCIRYIGVFLRQRTHLRRTRFRLFAYAYIYIYLYMHAYVYGCVCASMELLDTLKRCYSGSISVHTCAYACVCICVCMYACTGACVYLCICICICVCICIHIHLYTRACGCTYALV